METSIYPTLEMRSQKGKFQAVDDEHDVHSRIKSSIPRLTALSRFPG
ncbi:MAG: hypothetical protein V8R52_14030 [Coprobacter fastidiosus]